MSSQADHGGRAKPKAVLRARDIDAAIFDLDGVVTRTARVHAAAWKRLFDDFLQQRAAATGESFKPFDTESDYPRYVDGKPRLEGIRSFLAARGIDLPQGRPDDGETAQTIHGLAARKNRYFHEHLQREGVEVFDSTLGLLQELRQAGIKTALASSSRNAAAVLDRAGIAHLFDARVDGNDLAALGLKGKPAPDLFLLAAARLGVAPARAVVFEDAISGVEAGRSGGFAHVVGVDRRGMPELLRRAGADIVVADLAEVQVDNAASEGPDR